MTYYEAKSRVIRNRIAGSLLALSAGTVVVVSLLQMIYFRLDDGSQLSGLLVTPFKNLVALAYQNTQIIEPVWQFAPIPDVLNLGIRDNAFFLIVYIALLVGVGLFSSANRLSCRLRSIDEAIENESIKASVQGKVARTKEQVRSAMEVKSAGLLTTVHQFYVAPLIVGVAVGLILLLIGVGSK